MSLTAENMLRTAKNRMCRFPKVASFAISRRMLSHPYPAPPLEGEEVYR